MFTFPEHPLDTPVFMYALRRRCPRARFLAIELIVRRAKTEVMVPIVALGRDNRGISAIIAAFMLVIMVLVLIGGLFAMFGGITKSPEEMAASGLNTKIMGNPYLATVRQIKRGEFPTAEDSLMADYTPAGGVEKIPNLYVNGPRGIAKMVTSAPLLAEYMAIPLSVLEPIFGDYIDDLPDDIMFGDDKAYVGGTAWWLYNKGEAVIGGKTITFADLKLDEEEASEFIAAIEDALKAIRE